MQHCESPAHSIPKTGLRAKQWRWPHGHQCRRKLRLSTEFCLLPQSNPAIADHKVDKKRTVLPNFVYSRTHGTPSGPNNAFHVPSPDAMRQHRNSLLCIFNEKKRNLRFIRENSALIIQMFLILQRLRNKEHFETYSWLVIPRRPSCDP